ncbi:uncharacterized protein [Euphorbia lathyris]|uniref:uncharacterized protein isoform X1 n=1 Tax=Euphorbia lathyris TaxID=212925 RepID=UPI0033136915
MFSDLVPLSSLPCSRHLRTNPSPLTPSIESFSFLCGQLTLTKHLGVGGKFFMLLEFLGKKHNWQVGGRLPLLLPIQLHLSHTTIVEVIKATEAFARAGLESSNLLVGTDFTKSNEWTGK